MQNKRRGVEQMSNWVQETLDQAGIQASEEEIAMVTEMQQTISAGLKQASSQLQMKELAPYITLVTKEEGD